MKDKERMKILAERAKGQDRDAFGELYGMVYQDLYKTALYTLKHSADAENVVSEAVLDAYLGIGNLRDPGSFKVWIFRILAVKCRRQMSVYIRERGSQPEDFAGMQDERDPIGAADSRIMAEKAFSALNDRERMIVSMTIYGGFDSRETAAVLKMNRNTVRSVYHRALRKMRAALGED